MKSALIVILLFILSCNDQKPNTTKLIGKWQSYKVEKRDGRQFREADTLDGFLFTETGKHFYYFNNKPQNENDFVLRNNLIYFGVKPVYELESVNDKELIVIQLPLFGDPGPNDTREYFKRVENFLEIKPISK